MRNLTDAYAPGLFDILNGRGDLGFKFANHAQNIALQADGIQPLYHFRFDIR